MPGWALEADSLAGRLQGWATLLPLIWLGDSDPPALEGPILRCHCAF